MGVPVTVIELGDYHAPQTREAEAFVRELVEGADARARLFWKDTDLGEGAAYQAAARAALAAREQDAFWSMHDRLMKGPVAPTAKTVRQIARVIDLDLAEFDTAFNSDSLVAVLQSGAESSGRLPVLTTPSFIVNGRIVDGGSVASGALRAAVDEESILADGKREGSTIAAIEAAVARHARQIEAGHSVSGPACDGVKIARAAADTVTRHLSQPRPRSD
jgi:protein-disulfide isomerase